ncbi:hypothetical protein AX16_001816 [Volvariella volvacea WC 439]|nr:hypothetical protein AX16_001816 [Volvariella volvacea WC 439]
MAASVLQARIIKDTSRQLYIREIDNTCLSNISKLLRWPNANLTSNDLLEFRIEKPFVCASILPELHAICAASGHAPTLLAYQRLPGGWYGVAMEYAADAVPITLHKSISEHLERWETDLRGLVAEFHNKGFVHGDLRDANIIIGNDGHVILIDFDWGGRDGEVSYPTPMLNPELVEGRSPKGLGITKEDDSRILENTLVKTSAKILRSLHHDFLHLIRLLSREIRKV